MVTLLRGAAVPVLNHQRFQACLLSALYVAFAAAGMLPAQDRTAQVLILKDPTPREPDLEKRFKTSQTPFVATPAQIASYNQQRLQLIGQASKHMYLLAKSLQAAVEQPQAPTTLAQEAQIAATIETSAANIYQAMASSREQPQKKPGNFQTSVEKKVRETQLTLDTKEDAEKLTTLTEALQNEVSRSTPEILAVGVLIKSAQVNELARSLKLQFQPTRK